MNVVMAQNVSLRDHLALSTYLSNVAKSLAGQGEIDLHLVVQRGRPFQEFPEESIHEIEADTYSPVSNYFYAQKLFQTLRRISRETEIDVIHCLYPNTSVLGALAFKRFCRPQTKIIYDIRSPWIEGSIQRLGLGKMTDFYRRLAYLTEMMFCKGVDGFIFITEGLQKVYEEALKRSFDPLILIPSGVDLGAFTRSDSLPVRGNHGIGEKDVLVGYVGVLSRERELDFPMMALAEVLETDRRYKLMLVGDGNDADRLRRVRASLGLEENVIMTGRVEHEAVPDYISSFDLGLCHLPDTAFFRNSFPMKVLEYAACGVPIIASSIDAHREIAADIPMVLYENGSPTHLAEQLLAHADKPNGNGHDIAAFSWPSIADKIAGYYQYIMAT